MSDSKTRSRRRPVGRPLTAAELAALRKIAALYGEYGELIAQALGQVRKPRKWQEEHARAQGTASPTPQPVADGGS